MTKHHILIVDDDQRERKTLVEWANAEGYSTTEAASGKEALATLRAGPVDLVLTELFMADTDGWDLLDQVKAMQPPPHVVVTTGNITEQGEALLANRKADGYLIKPVQRRPLQIILRALLTPGNLDRPTEVMAVSGDRVLLQMIDETLAARGISVRCFTDTRKAAAHLWDDPPDLVLAGIKLGRENGFDLCERIRLSEEIPPLPILLLAHQLSPLSVRRAVRLRVNGVLLAPFKPDLLVQRVFQLLRRDGGTVKKESGSRSSRKKT